MSEQRRVAWVTGGGSGIGAATARSLASAGLAVAVTGRREAELEKVAESIRRAGGRAFPVTADVSSAESVDQARRRIEDEWGAVTDLICAAGANVPNRMWSDTELDDFERIVDINLTAVVRTIHSVLPGMRAGGGGRITAISSWAAWTHSPGAGIAYASSKTALRALVATLNDQEGPAGIHACHLCPGDVDTPFLEKRPSVPEAAVRATMLRAEDVAEAVRFVAERPDNVTINELIISPLRNLAYRR